MSLTRKKCVLLSDGENSRKSRAQDLQICKSFINLFSCALLICVILLNLATKGTNATTDSSPLKVSSEVPLPPYQKSKPEVYTKAIAFLTKKKIRLQEQKILEQQILQKYHQEQLAKPHVLRISNEQARYTVLSLDANTTGNQSHNHSLDDTEFQKPRDVLPKLLYDEVNSHQKMFPNQQEINDLANQVADATLYNVNNTVITSRAENGRSLAVSSIFTKFAGVLDLSRVVREIESSVMSSVSCSACRAGVSLLNHYINSGKPDSEIAHAAIKLCINLKMQTPRVCSGIVNLYVAEVLEVMKGVVLDSNDICALVIGESCGEPISPNWRWSVVFPPIPKPPFHGYPEPKVGAPRLKVLQISDTHWDPFYEPGSNANCNEPLCCRKTSGPQPPRPHLGAGLWGDYRKCDTPRHTMESMFEHISQNHNDIDYILWTGDIPSHDIWNVSIAGNLKIIKDTVNLFTQYFPHTPIFPALGNHEGAPVNSFAPPWVKDPKYNIDWLYSELQNEWSRWLPDTTHSTIKNGAFYSTVIKPGFKIISLNTNYCNNKNWWLLVNSTDPVDELKWLIFELQSSELAHEKVHIIGHIPPGHADCMATWSKNYNEIISRYEGTVAAQFFGHTHYDELEIFYPKEDPYRPCSIAYIGPSVTPYFNLNPGYRIYYVDGDYPETTRSVIDHETWTTDLGEANRVRAKRLTWYKLYSALDAYGMTSLNPLQWDDLVMSMYKNRGLFNLYYRFYNKNSPVADECDEECRARLLCDIRSGRSHAREELCQPRPVHVRASRGGLAEPPRPQSKIFQIFDFISTAFSSIIGYIAYPFGYG